MSTETPRDNLVRGNFSERATITDGRTMVGYPIVFDRWTTIDSWEGKFKERIAPDALNKTLRDGGKNVKVLFNHGMDPQIGDKPLGKPSVLNVDARGLYAEVPFSETSYADDLLALMRDGAIDGQSFRFAVVRDDWEKTESNLPERTITELKLYEFGPVTFPAYQATTLGIRSRSEFDAWVGLDDERRQQIAQIIGVELRTSPADAGDTATSAGDAATETNDSEPLGAHSGVSIIRRRALAAAQLLRSHTENGSD